MLEDSLREMFASRVETPPAVDDPAGAAIRRGRRLRRRNAVSSSIAAAVALMITLIGVVSLRGWAAPDGGGSRPAGLAGEVDRGSDAPQPPRPTATPISAPRPGVDTGIGLDLRVGDQLWTTDGRQLPLSGVGEVTRAYRVPSGWVYGGAKKVRLMRTDGSSVALSGEEDRWVLSPDGGRMAFVIGTMLHVADIGPEGMAVRASLDVPPGTLPVAFLGERIVISGATGASRGYDILDPVRPRNPTWNAAVAAVYGVHDGAVVGLVRRAGRSCLAALGSRAAGLQVAHTGTCASGAPADKTVGRLAPDGGWLAEGAPNGLALLDVTRALLGQRMTAYCPVRSAVPPAWADSSTIVGADQRGAVRCRTDGSEQVVPLPPGIGDGWQFVPKMLAGKPR